MPIRPNGPGKYDDIATLAREKAKAQGVMLIVFGGVHGNGFSAQVPADVMIAMPEFLRDAADQIEKQMTES